MVPLLKPTCRDAPVRIRVRAGRPFRARPRRASLSRVINEREGRRPSRAIIPTDIDHDVDRFTPDERRVFDLVAKRLSGRLPSAGAIRAPTIVSEVEGETFRTRGKVTLEPGWRGVYGVEPDDPTKQDGGGRGRRAAEVSEGDAVRCVEATSEAKGDEATAPLHRCPTLLTAMEDGREARRGRGAGRGDEGARARHAGNPCRGDRDTDPSGTTSSGIAKDIAPTPKGCTSSTCAASVL